MITTILFIIFSSILFVAFVITVIIGLLSPEPKKYKLPVAIWILFLIVAGTALYRIAHSMSRMFEPRTGMEVYTAVLGKPSSCVQVKDYFDPVVPVMDDQLLLHFSTCPEEIERITTGHEFSVEKTTPFDSGYSETYVSWWKPEKLGDSVRVYDAMDHTTMHGQVIITNMDRTEGYCRDM